MDHVDICENRHGGNELSREAHESITGSKETLRLKILKAIRSQGPMTGEEIATSLHLRTQTASARCAELKRDGLVRPFGMRATTSGRNAAILELTKEAWDKTA